MNQGGHFLKMTVYYMFNINKKLPKACNFNFLIKAERHVKVTGRHVHFKCSNIS